MLVSIFPPGRGDVGSFETPFALKQDEWNDYSFQTLYHLYYRNSDSKEVSVTRIGPVKILRRGQTKADYIQIKESFETLSDEFCSVGISLDYYQRLNEIQRADRNKIVKALHDVVARPALQSRFRTEEGWATSLFRDNPDPEGYLADARAIYLNDYTALPELDASLKFQSAGWSDPLALNFDSPEPDFYFGQRRRVGPSNVGVLLPRRIIVLVGRNGSGKSTLLSRIARVAFASPSERQMAEIQSLGEFHPPAIGFVRIIAISYSAFDNFIVPGTIETDRKQVATDIEKGSGRYVYCGLRDIVAEARASLEATPDTAGDPAEMVAGAAERQATTKLKSLEQLAEEFDRLVALIKKNNDLALFDAALELLLADPSFGDKEQSGRQTLLGSDPRGAFLNWSTGHKIVLQVIASLVAYATRKSLVLFDEPEMHLHPPLAASLMHAVRMVLEEKNAFAIVATYSPVVLQETLARHVRIISRISDSFQIRTPGIQTFGENLGILTYDTFGLTAAQTDFHHVLDLLIEELGSLEAINRLFSPSLSGQALAYVMSGLAQKGKEA